MYADIRDVNETSEKGRPAERNFVPGGYRQCDPPERCIGCGCLTRSISNVMIDHCYECDIAVQKMAAKVAKRIQGLFWE